MNALKSINSIIDSLLTINGRKPRQVAKTLLIIFTIIYFTNKLKKKYFSNGLRYAIMQFIFIIYSKYKGKKIMKSKLNQIQNELEKSLIPQIIKNYPKNLKLPIQSISENELLSILTKWSKHEKSLWYVLFLYLL